MKCGNTNMKDFFNQATINGAFCYLWPSTFLTDTENKTGKIR